MTAQGNPGKLKQDQNGFVHCPFCGNRYLKRVFPDERCERLNVFCHKCKHELYITIRNGQSFYSQAPST